MWSGHSKWKHWYSDSCSRTIHVSMRSCTSHSTSSPLQPSAVSLSNSAALQSCPLSFICLFQSHLLLLSESLQARGESISWNSERKDSRESFPCQWIRLWPQFSDHFFWLKTFKELRQGSAPLVNIRGWSELVERQLIVGNSARVCGVTEEGKGMMGFFSHTFHTLLAGCATVAVLKTGDWESFRA